MSTNEQVSERRRITSSADLLRRGASLLKEACPKCRGLQVKYKDQVYCLNCDDVSSLLSLGEQPRAPAVAQPISVQKPQAPKEVVQSPRGAVISEREALKTLLEEKLSTVTRQLEVSQDYDQQAKLLDLISKYLETLEKLKRAGASS